MGGLCSRREAHARHNVMLDHRSPIEVTGPVADSAAGALAEAMGTNTNLPDHSLVGVGPVFKPQTEIVQPRSAQEQGKSLAKLTSMTTPGSLSVACAASGMGDQMAGLQRQVSTKRRRRKQDTTNDLPGSGSKEDISVASGGESESYDERASPPVTGDKAAKSNGGGKPLNVGDVIHYMHRRRKGPPAVLKDSFGVVVTESVVVTQKLGKTALPENTYGVVDIRSGEIVRREEGSIVKVRRVLAPNALHVHGGRACRTILDLLDLQLSQVKELVRMIYLQAEPIPRSELQLVLNSGHHDVVLFDRKNVARMIARLICAKRLRHVDTWSQVTSLGRLFVELTTPHQVPALVSASVSDESAALDDEDSWLNLDEGPSFEELLVQFKAEMKGRKNTKGP